MRNFFPPPDDRERFTSEKMGGERFKYFGVEQLIMQSSTEANGKNRQKNYDDVPSIQRIPLTRKEAAKYLNTCVVEACFRAYERGDKNARYGVKVA